MCRFILAVVLFASALGRAAPAFAAAETAAPQDAPPEALDLLHQMERLADGKPIPVVLVASPFTEAPKPVVPPNPDGLLAILQDLGAAYSSKPLPDDMPDFLRERYERTRLDTQPYGFDTPGGRLWTLALSRMWARSAPSPDAPGVLDRDIAAETLFGTMDAAQLARAGGPGLRWTDLTPPQQSALRSLVARPWAVTGMEEGEDGSRRARYVSASEAPLVPEACVLHLSVGFDMLGVSSPEVDGDEPAFPSYGLGADRPELVVRSDLAAYLQRAFPLTPHARKPSDLDDGAAALAKPLGLQGLTTLGKVTSAAAAVSGLPLRVDARWNERAVFVGDAAIHAGDALRIVTFALDGAWRQVGAVTLLTWDRSGLASEALRVNTQDAERDAADWRAIRDVEKQRRPGWTAMALKTLPAPPDVPIKPNAEQIAALLAALSVDTPEDESYEAMTRRARTIFEWSNLDAGQQEALRQAVADGLVHGRNPAKPFTAAQLPSSYLAGLDLRATLEIPGAGRLDASSVLGTLLANLDGSEEVMRALWETRQKRDKAEKAALTKRPLTLAHPVRAVQVSPLPPGEWPRLFQQMRRKGLNTLYVPVLWDGMTLFPSAHFPQMPLCDGRDLLAGILEQAKAQGVRVVGVVHVLAWRLPGSRVHWLTRHPELVDVDATGQGRWEWQDAARQRGTLEWLTAAGGDLRRRHPAILADYVRPDAPEVRARLLGLLAELRRYKGLSGVALADWTRFAGDAPSQSAYSFGEAAPPLGYTLTSRVSFLASTGVDPLDIEPFGTPFRRLRDLEAGKYLDQWAAFRFSQDAALARALLAAVEKDHPGGAHLFTFLPQTPDMPIPPADTLITWDGTTTGPRAARYHGATLPAEPSDSLAPDAPAPGSAEAAQARLDEFNTALHEAAPSARATGIFKADGIVLDFTASPDLMWDGLKLLPDARR